MWAFNRKKRIGYQVAFDLAFLTDLEAQKKIVMDGHKFLKSYIIEKQLYFCLKIVSQIINLI